MLLKANLKRVAALWRGVGSRQPNAGCLLLNNSQAFDRSNSNPEHCTTLKNLCRSYYFCRTTKLSFKKSSLNFLKKG